MDDLRWGTCRMTLFHLDIKERNPYPFCMKPKKLIAVFQDCWASNDLFFFFEDNCVVA